MILVHYYAFLSQDLVYQHFKLFISYDLPKNLFLCYDWKLKLRERNRKKEKSTRKKMVGLQPLIAAPSIGSSSGKCLLSMASWHGLTGSRVPHEVIAPRSGEVMSSNPGQLYNWAGGQWGDMKRDNEALELQCRSGEVTPGGSYVSQTAQGPARSLLTLTAIKGVTDSH